MQYYLIEKLHDDDDKESKSSHRSIVQAHERVVFSNLYDTNEVDKETMLYITDTFIPQFAIYNVNISKSAETLIENKIWEEIKKEKKLCDNDSVLTEYSKVCSHFGVNFDWKNDEVPTSINIIFNIEEDPPKVYIVAARHNEIKVRRITMNEDFTRIERKQLDDA